MSEHQFKIFLWWTELWQSHVHWLGSDARNLIYFNEFNHFNKLLWDENK